jgi:hypothetical protein
VIEVDPILILTGLYVVATFVYALFTYLILRANQAAVAAIKDQIAASVRPYVHFDLLVENHKTVKARLWNTGRTAAHKIRVSTTPQLRKHPQGENAPAFLTHNTIEFLAPTREIVEAIGNLVEFLVAPTLSLKGTVSYSDGKGNDWREPFQISLLEDQDIEAGKQRDHEVLGNQR